MGQKDVLLVPAAKGRERDRESRENFYFPATNASVGPAVSWDQLDSSDALSAGRKECVKITSTLTGHMMYNIHDALVITASEMIFY